MGRASACQCVAVGLVLALAGQAWTSRPAWASDDDGVESVANTIWEGVTSDGEHYTFYFEPYGTLAYTSPTGSYHNGRWSQVGGSVSFNMNRRYADYHTTVGDIVMVGVASNVANKQWTFRVVRTR